jgi:thymidylate synthase
MKNYIKKEWDWYLSEDLSIKNHPGIGTNPTWISCATKDDKQEVNSNYGWCVYSKDNGYQLENCLHVLLKDKTSRNALLMYTRPSIHEDMYRNGMHDMICTVFSQFFIRNNKLEMIHVMRSNDFKFGFLSDFAWSCLVYQDLFNNLSEIYTDLRPGKIRWTSTSMHLYSRHYDILKNLAKNIFHFEV